MKYKAIDLFSGCGGLSQGLTEAGFEVIACVENWSKAADVYRLNHPDATIIEKDICELDDSEFLATIDSPVHLVAGCPPCQGFSSLRKKSISEGPDSDPRNQLASQFVRVVRVFMPQVIMLENVPGLAKYHLFETICADLESLGYEIEWRIVNVSDYGVPQRRRRLVLLGSRIGPVDFPRPTDQIITVRDAIGQLGSPDDSIDLAHKKYAHHTESVQRIINLIPKDGGSRSDLDDEYQLECHKKKNVGFKDVYGRMSWDSPSPTITGGCLSPSKGRFIHPEENRGLSVREAALLQAFPESYIFPDNVSLANLSLMIGNALPPAFSKRQGLALFKAIEASDSNLHN